MPKEKHWCWKFYNEDGGKGAICKNCGTTYANGMLTRMINHQKNCTKSTIADRNRFQALMRGDAQRKGSDSITQKTSTSKTQEVPPQTSSSTTQESKQKSTIGFHVDNIDKETKDEVDKLLARVLFNHMFQLILILTYHFLRQLLLVICHIEFFKIRILKLLFIY